MSDQDVRASNAERERVIETLHRHAADGRLTMEEFEERVGEALAAITRADLDPVLRELPLLDPPPTAGTASGPGASRDDRGSARRERRWPGSRSGPGFRQVAGIAAIALAIILVAQGAWWVIFPFWWLVFPAIGLFGRRGAGHGDRHGGCGWGGSSRWGGDRNDGWSADDRGGPTATTNRGDESIRV